MKIKKESYAERKDALETRGEALTIPADSLFAAKGYAANLKMRFLKSGSYWSAAVLKK